MGTEVDYNCHTCKYEGLPISAEVCTTCASVGRGNWEPKEDRPGAGSLLEGILADRAKTHGDFGIHAACTQDLKRMAKSWMNAAGKNGLDNDKQEALDMIFHKVGRIVAGDPDTEDHWRDIAGYATLVADRCKVS